ncbi:MAG: hypothetical protein KDD47_01300 [Acidobacteria bacterium]|nr:hypothetical protein [Acidobacteriota bacterium]
MKVTIQIDDELYRKVKAKSALEGRAIREVTEDLYRRYVEGEVIELRAKEELRPEAPLAVPPWFAVLSDRTRASTDHAVKSIRRSIGKGIAREHGL